MIRRINLAAVSKSACLAAMLLVGAVFATTSQAATGPYFGQSPPGTTPTIFAPGILSLANRLEAGLAFSPDGNECFFTVPSDFNFSYVQLYYTKRVNNVWTTQAAASFSPLSYKYSRPFFSADGNKLYFTSNRNGTNDIWAVERTISGWGTPQVLPSPLNTSSYSDEGYSQTADGTIYFASNRSGGVGNLDIWRIRPEQPSQAENLGTAVNTSTIDNDPLISPDGRYLIFPSYRSGSGNGDLYVALNNGNGGFTTPVNMNTYCPGINTDAYEYGASLSPDERYLFFVRLNYNTQQCDDYWVSNPFYVPEPATVMQLGIAAMLLGLAGISRWRRRV
jgi:Tol biopolymer transport system component